MIQSYLTSRYEDFARGPHKFDCWGLVRDVLVQHAGVPAEHVPAFGHVHPDDKVQMDSCKNEVEQLFEVGQPELWSVGCQMHKRICWHVGVLVETDGRLMVLHTSRQWGPSLDTIKKFERLGKTVYYNYVG